MVKKSLIISLLLASLSIQAMDDKKALEEKMRQERVATEIAKAREVRKIKAQIKSTKNRTQLAALATELHALTTPTPAAPTLIPLSLDAAPDTATDDAPDAAPKPAIALAAASSIDLRFPESRAVERKHQAESNFKINFHENDNDELISFALPSLTVKLDEAPAQEIKIDHEITPLPDISLPFPPTLPHPEFSFAESVSMPPIVLMQHSLKKLPAAQLQAMKHLVGLTKLEKIMPADVEKIVLSYVPTPFETLYTQKPLYKIAPTLFRKDNGNLHKEHAYFVLYVQKLGNILLTIDIYKKVHIWNKKGELNKKCNKYYYSPEYFINYGWNKHAVPLYNQYNRSIGSGICYAELDYDSSRNPIVRILFNNEAYFVGDVCRPKYRPHFANHEPTRKSLIKKAQEFNLQEYPGYIVFYDKKKKQFEVIECPKSITYEQYLLLTTLENIHKHDNIITYNEVALLMNETKDYVKSIIESFDPHLQKCIKKAYYLSEEIESPKSCCSIM